MKVEPYELLNIVADSAKELVEENSEYSETVLIVMKLMTEKIKNKLLYLDVKDIGISEEDFKLMLKTDEEDS